MKTHYIMQMVKDKEMGGGVWENGLEVRVVRSTNKALAGMAQWIECQPVNQRVAGSIPRQGTCLGCGPGHVPSRGRTRGHHTLMVLSL